jgi:OOP family OmpA-OmpF porin
MTVLLASVLAAGCSGTRPASPGTCALVGAGIGGLGGTGAGLAIADGDHDNEGAYIGAASGAAVGALTGYAICSMMPEPAAPAPVPASAVESGPVIRKTVVLPGVNFAFDRADLLPAARETLDREVASELAGNSALTMLVEGHTDAVGSDAYNLSLSQRRADAVKSYLVGKGISSSRIESRGLGETKPVASNDTAPGRAENRRVEIKVLE